MIGDIVRKFKNFDSNGYLDISILIKTSFLSINQSINEIYTLSKLKLPNPPILMRKKRETLNLILNLR